MNTHSLKSGGFAQSRRFCLLGCLLLLATAAALAEPATQPTTAPARIEPAKDETPLQAIARGCKVYDQLDVDRSVELFQLTARNRYYVRSGAFWTEAITAIEKRSRSKFGDKKTEEWLHAVGICVEADVPRMQVTIEGDRARIVPPEGCPPFEMVLENGVWLYDMDSAIQNLTAAEVKEVAAQNLADAVELKKVASDLADGKMKSSAELLQRVKAIVDPPPTK